MRAEEKRHRVAQDIAMYGWFYSSVLPPGTLVHREWVKKDYTEAEEMDGSALAALPMDLASISSTHTVAHNYL